MKIHKPQLKKRIYVYTTHSEYDGHEFKTATFLHVRHGKRTMQTEVMEAPKRLFKPLLPKELLRAIEAEVKQKHSQLHDLR